MKHLSEFVIRVALPTLVFFTSVAVTQCAEPNKKPQQGQPIGFLRLVHGDHVSGTLLNSLEGQPDGLVWKHPQFAEPFQYLLQSVDSVTFPDPPERKLAKGGFFVELLDGDRVFGDIVGFDENSLLIRTDEWGELKIAKAAVQRLARWSSGKAVQFSGPGKLSQWSSVGDQSIWHDQGGQLATSIRDASIYRDIGLPDVARIELELSWVGTPNFVLAIGVDQENLEASAKSAYRIEVWKNEVVLLRELEDAADIASLGVVGDFAGNLNLVFDLEQNAGKIQVSSPQGEPLAQLQLRSNDFPDVRSAIQLTNLEGSIRLNGLQVMSGRARPAGDEKEAGTRFVLDNNATEAQSLVGDWIGIEDGAWIVKQGDQEERVSPKKVLSVEFSDDASSDREPSEKEQPKDRKGQQVQVTTHAGNSLTGGMGCHRWWQAEPDVWLHDGICESTDRKCSPNISLEGRSKQTVKGWHTHVVADDGWVIARRTRSDTIRE